METKQDTAQRTWLTPRQAADYVGINYPRFTRIAKREGIPRTLVPGTKRTYRYKISNLDEWMHANEENGTKRTSET